MPSCIRYIGSLTLAFVLLAGSSWPALHAFLSHGHRHEHRVCHISASDEGTTHIHDQRYEGDHCGLCDFIPLSAEETREEVGSLTCPVLPLLSYRFVYEGTLCESNAYTLFVRGPPMAV